MLVISLHLKYELCHMQLHLPPELTSLTLSVSNAQKHFEQGYMCIAEAEDAWAYGGAELNAVPKLSGRWRHTFNTNVLKK